MLCFFIYLFFLDFNKACIILIFNLGCSSTHRILHWFKKGDNDFSKEIITVNVCWSYIIYVHIRTKLYDCVHICVHMYICVHICIYMYKCIYICTYMYIYVYICIYVYITQAYIFSIYNYIRVSCTNIKMFFFVMRIKTRAKLVNSWPTLKLNARKKSRPNNSCHA